jgi:hypothetical protein
VGGTLPLEEFLCYRTGDHPGPWSFGIVLAQACGLTTIAVTLAYVLACSALTIRAQLRTGKGVTTKSNGMGKLSVSGCPGRKLHAPWFDRAMRVAATPAPAWLPVK